MSLLHSSAMHFCALFPQIHILKGSCFTVCCVLWGARGEDKRSYCPLFLGQVLLLLPNFVLFLVGRKVGRSDVMARLWPDRCQKSLALIDACHVSHLEAKDCCRLTTLTDTFHDNSSWLGCCGACMNFSVSEWNNGTEQNSSHHSDLVCHLYSLL